jgi:outer membrane protein TolC
LNRFFLQERIVAMKPAISVILLSALLCLPALPAGAQPLDLRTAERLALERNLQLRAETFATRASEAAVRREYGLYDPLAAASLAEGTSRDRTSFIFQGGLIGKEVVKYRQFDFSLTQKAPTGADLTASFTNLRQDSSLPTRTFDPSYRSELKLSLVQPLLKNFGRTVTEQQILFAVKDREISVQDLRARAFDVLSRVRDAWYEVLRRRADLGYREASVELARQVLEENRARVEVGVLPPVDILEAEVGLKTRERELLDAQRAYQDAVDALGVLLDAIGTVEVADEELGQPELATDEEAGLLAALEKRPELLRQVRSIERVVIERRVARNQLLPALDLIGSYSHKGLGEDYNDTMDDVASENFVNWEVGVNLSYPLGNRTARNEYRRSQLRLKGEQARLAQLREEVRQEIRAAIRLLEVSRKVIEAADRGRELAEEKLRTLLKRKEVGLATTRDVLEGEEDLALARTDLSAALADYNRAITGYLRVTGQLLEHEGIRFAGPVDLDEGRPLLEMTE